MLDGRKNPIQVWHTKAICPQSPAETSKENSMVSNRGRKAGRHFLQIPGPSPVPDRILRAMDMPVIDHRGPEIRELGLRCLLSIQFRDLARSIIAMTNGASTSPSPARRRA